MRRLETDEGTIIVGDCIAAMAAMEAASVDCGFADPPYNLRLPGRRLVRPDASAVAGVADAWDRIGDGAAYDRFTRDWLSAMRRLLKPDATLWVTGTYHNIFRVGAILQDLGFWILNDIVWRKPNPMPNFRGRRFTNAHETLIWAARSERAAYRFDYRAMKALNDDLQMRSDWSFPVCAGAERLRQKDGRKLHPTQKPEALLYRVLLASSAPGDTVLDPFFGTGTTGAVARRIGRRYVGIESDARYARAAHARVSAVVPDEAGFEPPPIARDLPRVPFGALVESGILRAGEKLTDATGRVVVRVRGDGKVVMAAPDRTSGSIHEIASRCTGRPGTNGWTFFCTSIDGRREPIDTLRTRLRAASPCAASIFPAPACPAAESSSRATMSGSRRASSRSCPRCCRGARSPGSGWIPPRRSCARPTAASAPPTTRRARRSRRAASSAWSRRSGVRTSPAHPDRSRPISSSPSNSTRSACAHWRSRRRPSSVGPRGCGAPPPGSPRARRTPPPAPGSAPRSPGIRARFPTSRSPSSDPRRRDKRRLPRNRRGVP